MSEKRGLTLSVAGSKARVHKRLIGRFNCEHALEVMVDVRENGHYCGPDQGAVVILRGLYGRSQSYGGRELHEITHVELNVRGTSIRLILASGFSGSGEQTYLPANI